MKKIYISKRSPVAFTILLLILFIIGLILYIFANIKDFGFFDLYCCIICFILPMGGCAAVFLDKKKNNNLSYIKLSPTEIIFVVYKNNTTEETQFMLSDIQSCQMQIYSRIEQNNFSRCTSQDITKLTFIVKNQEEQEFSFCSDLLDINWMKNVFSIAKNIPNFSYVVDANADCFIAEVESYSKKSEGVSLREYVRIFFSDKSVSEDKKIFVKFLFCVACFWICCLVFVIGLFIRDIIKYSFI